MAAVIDKHLKSIHFYDVAEKGVNKSMASDIKVLEQMLEHIAKHNEQPVASESDAEIIKALEYRIVVLENMLHNTAERLDAGKRNQQSTQPQQNLDFQLEALQAIDAPQKLIDSVKFIRASRELRMRKRKSIHPAKVILKQAIVEGKKAELEFLNAELAKWKEKLE